MSDYIFFELKDSNIQKISKLIKEQGFSVCRNIIEQDYILKTINECSFGWIKMNKKAQIGQAKRGNNEMYVSSFLICSIDNDLNAIEIDLLCNRNKLKKEGIDLLKLCEEYGKKFRFKILSLNSIEDRVSYYTNNGFEIRKMIIQSNCKEKVYNMRKYIK